MNNKWDRRFLRLAEDISHWSKDPSTKTGTVIVRPNKTISSIGYNGFPRGMSDNPSLYENRDVKYSRILHAEVNAILNAYENLYGHTLYTYPLIPCDRCAVIIIQSGIVRVVAPKLPSWLKDRWEEPVKHSISF